MTASRSVTSIDLWCAIARDPLRVSPTTSVRDAIARMEAAAVSCVLVVEDSRTQDGRLLGLLTESDLVSLYLQPTPLHQVTVQAVVKPPIVQLAESQLGDIAGVFRLFGQHPICHLPIVDERDRPVGLLTQAALSKLLVEDILGNPTPSPSSEKAHLSVADEAKIAHSACCQATQAVEAVQDPSEIQALLTKQNAELLESNEQLQEALEELRVAEESLRQQNLCLEDERQKYSDLFNFAPDGYLTTNRSGVIESANQAIAFQLGVKSDELIGKPLVVFILPGDHASFYNQLGQPWAQEHRRTQEITFQSHEGKRFVAEVTLAPIYGRSNTVTGLRWLVRDMSDRRAAERALKQTESQSSAILAAIPDMMFRVGANGVYRQVMTPHHAMDILPPGYNPVGQRMHNFLPPDLAQRQQLALEQALQTGELLIYEQTVQVGDRHQDEEVRVIKCGDDEVLFMVRDITERKRTETALKQSEKTNRAILNAIPDLLIRMDLAGRYHSILAGANIQVKQPSKIVAQPTVYDMMPPDQAERRLGYARRAVESGTLQVYEQRFDVNGTLQDEEVRLTPLNDQEVLIIIRDIGARKQAERELQTLNQTLEAKIAERTALLQASEASKRAIIAALPDLLLRVKRDGTCLEYIPPSQKDEWCTRVEHHLSEVLPPDSLARELAAIALALDTGKLQVYELEYTQGDLHVFEEVRVSPITDEEALLVVRDVGDRKQSELENQSLRERLQFVLSASPVAIYTCKATASFDCTFVSDNITALLGYTPEQFLSETGFWSRRIHPDDAAKVFADLSHLFETGCHSHEYRFRHHDGHYCWLRDELRVIWDDRGVPLELIGGFSIIDARKQAEAELQASQEQLLRSHIDLAKSVASLQRSNALLMAQREASFDGILVIDEHRRVATYNRRFLLLWNIPQPLADSGDDRQLLGFVLSQLLDPDDFVRRVEYLYSHPQEISHEEISLKDDRIFERYSAPVHANDEHYGRVWFFRDISDRKQTEAELQASNSQLIRSNNELARANRFKDEFLSTISHELRTPLNAVLGLAEGLQEQVFGDINPNQRKALDTIRRSGTHLLNIINDILDLTNLSTGQLTLTRVPTSVSMLCQTCIDLVQPLIQEKRIQVEVQIQPNLPNLDIDGQRIQQVLVNLLSNAVKFTAAGGRVSLAANVQVRGSAGNESDRHPYLHLEIVDTGIGIAPEELSRLFQPFTQVDSALNRQHEGTGLGLAIVQRIVELHGGTVSVHSTVGIGSRFTVNLPLNRQLMPFANPTTDFQSEPMQTTANVAAIAPLILLAEDNEANIITIASYLEAKGYRLVVAKDGQAAVDCAKAHHPDLILMDVQMPVLDGLDATQQIRCDPDLLTVPIIALTALAMPNDRQICLDAGADEYLSKPVRLKELIQMIQRLLANAAANSAANSAHS